MVDWRKTLAELTCCGLCCVGTLAVYAAPPVASNPATASGLLGRASGLLAGKSIRTPASRVEFNRLDLRPPESSGVTAAHEPPAEATAFPSMKRQTAPSGERAESDLPALGGGSNKRLMSKPEEIAHRIQHEGLPVARLWQSHSALISLGLSPRGKPGLWLIQKVP
jgi:hypothetical protein